jgi:flagellar biogenesis protein FliO
LSDAALHFLLSSLAVIGLLLALYAALLRFGAAGRFPLYGRELKVLDKVPLNKDSGVVLLAFRGRRFLLYYGPSGATLLKEWGEEEVRVGDGDTPLPKFSLRRNFKRGSQ